MHTAISQPGRLYRNSMRGRAYQQPAARGTKNPECRWADLTGLNEPITTSLNFSRDLFGSDVVRAGRRVGLIVPDGHGRSAGVARGRAFHGRWGPRVGWRVSCCSGEGGPKSLPSFGYRGGPAPGGVDA